MNESTQLEKLREKIARELSKIQHPAFDWGHNGTVDDESWRRFEQLCLEDADEILSLLAEGEGMPVISDEEIKKLYLPCEETADCPYGEYKGEFFETPCEYCRGKVVSQAQAATDTIRHKAILAVEVERARKEVVDFVRFIITHLDSQYGFIKKLEASPDWQAKLKEWGIALTPDGGEGE